MKKIEDPNERFSKMMKFDIERTFQNVESDLNKLNNLIKKKSRLDKRQSKILGQNMFVELPPLIKEKGVSFKV